MKTASRTAPIRAGAASKTAAAALASSPDDSQSRWWPIIIVLVVACTFGRICGNEFVGWDDPHTIASNPNFNPPTLAGLLYHWTHAHEALYVPITYSVWWLLALGAYVQTPDAARLHLNPWIFHAASVAAHAGAA